MDFDLLKVSFSHNWILPTDLYNKEIILFLIWELVTHQIIWYQFKDIWNVEIIITHEVDTKIIPLWWWIKFRFDYDGLHKMCIIEFKFIWNEVNLDIVALKKTFWIMLEVKGPCCVIFLRGYMGVVFIKPCMMCSVDIIWLVWFLV